MARPIVTSCFIALSLTISGAALAVPGPPGDTQAESSAPDDEISPADLSLRAGAGTTHGAHTNGFTSGLELDLRYEAVELIFLGQASAELFDAGWNRRGAVGLGPNLELGSWRLSAAPVLGYSSYKLREGCLIWCDDDRPTEYASSPFAGVHAAVTFAVPTRFDWRVLLSLGGDATRDFHSVGSQAPGWQYSWLASLGASFDL
ncbi:MAG: hypothetical protein KC766_04965 [Myxococcales bacterium]|nr:hypothetical protein [Myxococcales bacterium]